MAGKLYLNDIRLSKAYAEGFANAGGAGQNPHPAGSPAHAAWAEGDTQGQAGSCAEYAGSAECTGVLAAPLDPGRTGGRGVFSAPFGDYVVGADASVAKGEIFVDASAGKVYVNVTDNGDTDQTTALKALGKGDTLRVVQTGASNWVDVVLTEAPTTSGGIVTFTGSATPHGAAAGAATGIELLTLAGVN